MLLMVTVITTSSVCYFSGDVSPVPSALNVAGKPRAAAADMPPYAYVVASVSSPDFTTRPPPLMALSNAAGVQLQRGRR